MASENSGPPAEPAAHRRLRELTARAKAGDPRAVPEIRDLLREQPDIADWLGDMGRVARAAWLDLLTRSEPAVRQAADLRAEERRAELAGPAAPPTERMLADLITNLELEVHEASLALALNPTGSPAVTAARTRRADSAVRRLLAATRMLRDVQALLPNGQAPNPRLKVFDPTGRKTG
ncbi:MAG: hypothetical protein U0794_23660 [Isosphaeraceae bacterium]